MPPPVNSMVFPVLLYRSRQIRLELPNSVPKTLLSPGVSICLYAQGYDMVYIDMVTPLVKRVLVGEPRLLKEGVNDRF